jgi:hypothetical protein
LCGAQRVRVRVRDRVAEQEAVGVREGSATPRSGQQEADTFVSHDVAPGQEQWVSRWQWQLHWVSAEDLEGVARARAAGAAGVVLRRPTLEGGSAAAAGGGGVGDEGITEKEQAALLAAVEAAPSPAAPKDRLRMGGSCCHRGALGKPGDKGAGSRDGSCRNGWMAGVLAGSQEANCRHEGASKTLQFLFDSEPERDRVCHLVKIAAAMAVGRAEYEPSARAHRQILREMNQPEKVALQRRPSNSAATPQSQAARAQVELEIEVRPAVAVAAAVSAAHVVCATARRYTNCTLTVHPKNPFVGPTLLCAGRDRGQPN